jgi:hypothetical protein
MLDNNVPTSLCIPKVMHSFVDNIKKLGLLETFYIKKAVDNNVDLFNSQLERNDLFELVTPYAPLFL